MVCDLLARVELGSCCSPVVCISQHVTRLVKVSLVAQSEHVSAGAALLSRRGALLGHTESVLIYLAPQKVVVAVQNLVHVERLVFLHLLLHQVLHDPRVEVVACLLVWNVVLLRVVEKSFAVLILF